MKRKTLYLTAVSLLIGTIASILPALAAGVNLVANNSVETAETTGKPTNWRANKWGTNTATMSYATAGKTGSRSLLVTMTAHTSGDAKWMHDAVSVKGNTSYTYTSAYKASVETNIIVQYADASGKFSYVDIATVPSAVNWNTTTATFTTPTSAVKVVVLHVINKKGTLQTDDFSIAETNAVITPTPTPTPTPNPTTPPVDHDHSDHQHNLIANDSFEVANGTTPAAWYKNNWGNNTASFTYDTTGYTGTRSATVTMTAHTDGDAKWYAEAVSVAATKNYIYRDFYKSNIPTRVVVAYLDANNNYSYQELAGAVASSAWKQYSATFTVPAGAVKASVFHVIDRVGSLSIDDAILEAALPPAATPALAVPNASLETANGALPASWNTSSWGVNSPSFQYMNEGRTGTKSAKVTMSNYTSGDAKWYFDPIKTVEPGKRYRATMYYKSNIEPHAVAMVIMADGTERYYAMPSAPASAATWRQYSDTFSVPTGAVSASVFMYINQNGWLQTDDYSLSDYVPNGYNRPLVTMTFDDGHEDNTQTALPIMNQYGLKSTQCYATSFIEGKSQSVIDDVLAFQNSGHEICSHTVTHPFLTTLNASNLTFELQHSKQYLEKITGRPVVNFASPYGDYNTTVTNEVKKYYRSHRSVDEGYNSKDNFNIYNLRVQNVLDTTSASQIAAWIAQAKMDNTWLILVYHRVANDPGPFDSYTSVFAEHAKVISESGVAVKTYNDALNEVLAQQ